MKRSVFFGLFCSMLLLFFVFFNREVSDFQNKKSSNHENEMRENDQYLNRLLADPATGKIPKNIRYQELLFASTLPVNSDAKRNDIWKSRGPFNQGGRTRAFAANVLNSNELIAGSATGGIYKSVNSGKSWRKTACPVQAITCLVQDRRPGKENIWYAGTGELSGSSGSGGGAYYYGAGILKSTDFGETWTQIPSTVGNSFTSFDSNFDGVWNIAIDESNLTEDEIYAAVYSGIYKSTDGGTSWKVKRSGSIGTYSYYTNVSVDSKGVVYATLSDESTHRGIWRSPDGEVWTSIRPAGFPTKYGRIAIGIAPSDENQVYFLVSVTTNFGLKSTNFQGEDEWNSLWKYDYISGTGAGVDGRWTNKSANLPAKGGDFGYFSTQGGYDLYVNVHPADTNLVFLGVTNLWRSKDGFRTTQNTDWIGGYNVNTFRPDYKLYPNHHPDNHFLFFMKDKPNQAYSAHDGGVSYTTDITAQKVEWEYRNDHYITSQFYTVAIDHATDLSQLVIGGLQDNGTQFVNQYGLSAWHMSYNSDGSHCFVRNGGKEIYASAQLGRIARVRVDSIGRALEYARLDPAQLNRNNYDFINPFSIDPNNQNILYLPAKTELYRNTDINSKPLSALLDSNRWDTPLWEKLINISVPNGHEISAITTSKSNPNTVYYATDRGKLYKINNANIGQPSAKDISGPNFSSGNINCIALDPIDSNSIMVVFSNYSIISLFHSKNGGQTWTNVSGNLEVNANGSGAGPSCRWAAVMPLQNGKRTWFVGTSIGLYATDSISNSSVWIKQSPNGIGNNIVTMIDTRPSDYQIAVSTHGNGVYSANIANAWQITSVNSIAKNKGFNLFPNPVSELSFQIQNIDLFNKNVEVKILSLNGKIIENGITNIQSLDEHNVKVSLNNVAPGIYFILVKNGSVSEYKKIIIH
jgi:photosystem II stability/assembly factor-like uncharacterized protein